MECYIFPLASRDRGTPASLRTLGWVRAMHDFIALGVVPAVRTALIALAVTLLGLGIWFVVRAPCYVRWRAEPA